MPRNKSNRKRGGGVSKSGTATPPLPRPRNEDNDSLEDNWSTQSILSDDSSCLGSDPAVVSEENVEESEQENFEDRFNDFVDATLVKRTESRVKALSGIQSCLQKKYMSDFLYDRKETVSDNLMKCLRKGKGEEQTLAASCLSLMALQLGDDAEDIFLNSQPLLTSLMADNSTPYKTRGMCASSLALSCLLCCDDHEKIKSITKALEDIFVMGYGKGENSPSVSHEMSWLLNQALSAWCLLVTVAPAFEVQAHINNHLRPLQDLLQNSDVDLRMTAGEAIALLYELARDSDEDFVHESEGTLSDLLKQLATDSVKHRAKKDKQKQRSCFRDVQRFIVETESPSVSVKVGKDNLLELGTWSQKRQYDSLCHILSTGTSEHLKANPLVRDIFHLGSPGLDEYSHTKSLSKQQRTFINAAAFKARTKARAKHRDKRSVMANGF